VAGRKWNAKLNPHIFNKHAKRRPTDRPTGRPVAAQSNRTLCMTEHAGPNEAMKREKEKENRRLRRCARKEQAASNPGF
jgi:hypothetical protein